MNEQNEPSPGGSPELTEAEKRRIESEMTVVAPDTGGAMAEDTAQPQLSTGKPGPHAASGSDSATDNNHDNNEQKIAAPYGQMPEEPASGQSEGQPEKTGRKHRIRRFFGGYWRHKKWTIPLTLLAVAGALAAVPYTRYPIAGLFLKQRMVITVVDSSTKKPVSSASVEVDGQPYKTDKEGRADIGKVKVGKHTLKVSKKYYKDTSSDVFVPLLKDAKEEVAIQATGRQVAVVVINKITKKPLADATLKASGTEVKTDKEGKAVIVLPAERSDLPVTVNAGGYNSLESRVKVTDAVVPENTFAVVPSGKVYFLSRQSGKIDVIKTDLDGTNRQTVVYGTGKEDDKSTVLLASRDWKYLALLSRRDSGLAKLYLIDTAADKLTTIDEGDVSFNLSGWSGHNFVFNILRNNLQPTDANRLAVKKYDADKHQLITVDQTNAEKTDAITTQYQDYSGFSLLGDKLIYAVQWYYASGQYYGGRSTQPDRPSVIRSVSMTDGSKKDLKTFPAGQYGGLAIRVYEPGGLYIGAYSSQDSKNIYFSYEDGKIEQTTATSDNDFYNTAYATYLTSPDGNKTFWSEQRDGKETFFVGDADGENDKQVGVWSDYKAYGWYTDSYLLVSKGKSELYIVPAAGGDPLKIADYHKPQLSYNGYGGGYGGY